ncbi:MAG: hypothetical protein C4321_00130 [Chloroflexota bacterium]
MVRSVNGSAMLDRLAQHYGVTVIETPNGAISTGRCKRCGIVRDFRNSSEDPLWDSDSFSLNGSRLRGRRASDS